MGYNDYNMYKILVLLQPVNRLMKEHLLDKELCMHHNQNTYHDQQQIIDLMLSWLVLRVSASYFLFERKFSKSRKLIFWENLDFLISKLIYSKFKSRNINQNFENFVFKGKVFFSFLMENQIYPHTPSFPLEMSLIF